MLEVERAIYKGLAFAARYGKADPMAMTGIPWRRRQLLLFNKAIEELLNEEKSAIDRVTNTDG